MSNWRLMHETLRMAPYPLQVAMRFRGGDNRNVNVLVVGWMFCARVENGVVQEFALRPMIYSPETMRLVPAETIYEAPAVPTEPQPQPQPTTLPDKLN